MILVGILFLMAIIGLLTALPVRFTNEFTEED